MLPRPWIDLGGLWGVWSKWASGCTLACVSSRPHVTKGQTPSRDIPWDPLNSPQAAVHWVPLGTYADASLNRLGGYLRLMVKMGLWVHVCVRKLPPTSDLRSTFIAGDSLACPQPPADRGELSYIGNLSWRVSEWSWGAFEPYSPNGPLGARLRASAPAHKWLKVKLHRGDSLASPQPPASRGALSSIGNLCWRVPD